MKNASVLLIGVVIGMTAILLFGADGGSGTGTGSGGSSSSSYTQTFGRYQIAFGNVHIVHTAKNANTTADQGACMKIDTATGRVWTYVSKVNDDTGQVTEQFVPIEDYMPKQSQKNN